MFEAKEKKLFWSLLNEIVIMRKGSLSEIRGIFILWGTQQIISKPYSVRLRETY